MPGSSIAHMPSAVRMVFTAAMRACACSALPKSEAKMLSEGATVL